MPRAASLVLLALLLLSYAQPYGSQPTNRTDINPSGYIQLNANNNDNITDNVNNDTIVVLKSYDTLNDSDSDQEPIVRKKRTFGDVVFRGLADVLGYSVAKKPPQVAFPPPLAPVLGIDLPLQAAPAPAPVPVPAPAPATAPAPCGTPRAAVPPPCRVQPAAATKPKTPPPCPKPRAAPKPKPRPSPPPPPPPCSQAGANPTTLPPCASPPSSVPPPKQQAGSNLETISSNFRLDFNFNRAPATPAPAAADIAAEDLESEQKEEQEQAVPIAIEPKPARLPLAQSRKPRVYVDAFVVRNGVARKVNAIDAQHFDGQQSHLENDYLTYDEDEAQQLPEDDYEDVQESRDRAKAVHDFSDAVHKFWGPKRKSMKKLAENDYRNVHFGDRDLADKLRNRSDRESHQSLQRERPHSTYSNHASPLAEAEEESELTTTTEDPKRPLRPRVLPPTEKNPGQIDTVTVRVPPIYKERHPKKLHRGIPEQSEYLEHSEVDDERRPQDYKYEEEENDADSDNSAWITQTERPIKRKRRRKHHRQVRSTKKYNSEIEAYSAGDYDYYGNKLPISDEEKFYRELTVPPPTMDTDLARMEQSSENEHFLNDHERLREDPEKISSGNRSDDTGKIDETERTDDSERTDDKERSIKDKERTGDVGRADESGRTDEHERTDKLSPNARIHETGFQNNYVHSTNVQVDDPTPHVGMIKKRKLDLAK